MRPILALLTFVLVSITYVFFRAETFTDAFHLLVVMVTGADKNLVPLPEVLRVALVGA